MDAQHWSRLTELFDSAVELAGADREAFIEAIGAEDARLAHDLRRMLTADAGAGDFLEPPLAMKPSDYAPGSRRFGAYRLLRPLGAGGMGEVHLAERGDGAFEQQVALKLLPHPTPGLMQRFRQERQILARLEHPNIARLLDGGIGENNVPYFAMEFVDGLPITQYVRAQALDVTHTLQLFLRVCDAVQYAHRNLVVHRDLKPSNILVASDGMPKLLDFGIAKVLENTDDATQTAARLFTPDYAAPEQIRGEAITTAADVYALGVMLYELLSGARPYKLRRDESLQQAILNVDATAPSSAAANTTGDPARARRLRGDLDRIVLTAMAKEPERRYASVEAFATDIHAYLAGRPIAARGDSAVYRTRKFMRRNRGGVAAAAIVALALIVATGVSLWQAGIAREQAQRAETKSRTAGAVKDYLLSVFASANPYNTDGKVVTARDLLEGGLDQVEKKLAGQKQVQAEIYAGFVETFLQINNYTLGKRAGELALEKYRQFLPSDAIEILQMEMDLAQVDFYRTQFDGLIPRFENLLTRAGERGGDYASLRADVLTLLGMTHFRMGNYEQSVQTSEAAVAQLRKAHNKPFDYEIGIVLYNLYLARMAQGRFNDAAALISEFAPGDRLLVGPQHPGLFTDVTAIARLLQDAGRLHEAHDLLSAAVLARQRQFPEHHSLVVNTRGYLADVDCGFDDAARVETRFTELIAVANGPGTEMSATDMARLYFTHAQCLLRLGRLDEARRELEHAREKNLQVAAKDTPYVLAMDATLADIERRAGEPTAALAVLAPILTRQRERGDRELPASLLVFAQADTTLGQFTHAQAALDEARKVLDAQGRPTSVLAREIESAWAALPADVTGARGSAEHWQHAAQIGCVNFGCDDERVKQWQHLSAQAGGNASARPEAAAKPYEAQYAIGADIIAKAQAAAGAAPAATGP